MATDLEEHYDKIYRFCYMKIKHQQSAEDITQETFLRFLEEHTYKEMGKMLAYLYTIARNLCMDYFRRKEVLSLNEDMVKEHPDDAQSSMLRSIVLKQAVLRLEPDEQELIFLRFVNEVPVNHISKILGISRFAVYRKTKESLGKMQKELGEEWI